MSFNATAVTHSRVIIIEIVKNVTATHLALWLMLVPYNLAAVMYAMTSENCKM